MVERRAGRKRSRPSEEKTEDDVMMSSISPTTARVRIRPQKEHVSDIPGTEESVEESVMESGNGDVSSDTSVRPTKRKRDSHVFFASTPDELSTTEPWKMYRKFVKELYDSKIGEEFRMPVLKKYRPSEIPGYRQLITDPIDLGTILSRIENQKKYYCVELESDVYEFDAAKCAEDVRRVFDNCMSYNEDGSEFHVKAKELLRVFNERVQTYNEDKHGPARGGGGGSQERARREFERRRRKQAEEEADRKTREAAMTAKALKKVKQKADDLALRREEDLRKRDVEWRARLEEEKRAAVQAALREILAQKESGAQASHGTSQSGAEVPSTPAQASGAPQGKGADADADVDGDAEDESGDKMVNTSSVSSDEHENIGGNGMNGEIAFVFVSTKGLEKKRGRKSSRVGDLETQHEVLIRQRKAMLDSIIDLEQQKQFEMTQAEKKALCSQVSNLDYIRMNAVVELIAQGMGRPDLRNEIEIDLNMDTIDNGVLREIQAFLKDPVGMTAKDALRKVEDEIEQIESELVDLRYQKVPGQ